LLELTRVDLRVNGGGGKGEVDLDMRAEETPKEVEQPLQRRVHIQDEWLQHLLVAEREELARQARRARPARANLAEQLEVARLLHRTE
jgi:hypothetical protein